MGETKWGERLGKEDKIGTIINLVAKHNCIRTVNEYALKQRQNEIMRLMKTEIDDDTKLALCTELTDILKKLKKK